jgi:DNA-binding beta-propeller fold protein YncE
MLTTLLVLAAAAASVPDSGHASPPPYTISTRIPVGDEGGWDYLTYDPDGHRLFVSRSTHVQVVDARRDSVVGDIPNTFGVHGIALVPDVGRGYTSNGRDSSVTVFDLKTLKVSTTLRIPGLNPDAILYDPVSKRVFTFNGRSSDATAIDPAKNVVVGTVPLAGKPEAGVADGRGRIYVNIEDKSLVTCFDARTLKVIASWPVAPGEEPSGLAMDRVHRRLFSACGNQKLVVLDADSGKVVTSLPIGDRVDGAAFDPALQVALTTNGEGTLSVIHEDSADHYTKVADAPTQKGARTIALDEASHRVYTCTAQFGDTPAPTAEQPHPRPKIVPGSFVILALDAKVGTATGSH